MEHTRKLRVLVADGTPLTRIALVALTNRHPRFEVCAEASDARQARGLCLQKLPDVVLLDLDVPRGDGVELMRECRKFHPPVKSVVVTNRDDFLSFRQAFRAGALAYITKSDEGGEILKGLEAVLTGERFASRRVSHLMLQEMSCSGPSPDDRRIETLSDREIQVFRLIGRGYGVTAIAKELGVSVKTVETHQQRTKDKLELKTADELHKRAELWATRSVDVRAPLAHEFA
jgi:DNA-binding NarL/FixJ family response regulator